MLTVDVDETVAELAECGERYGRVVDEGAAFSRDADLASEDAVGRIVVDLIGIEEINSQA